jgi:hypothetical protein
MGDLASTNIYGPYCWMHCNIDSVGESQKLEYREEIYRFKKSQAAELTHTVTNISVDKAIPNIAKSEFDRRSKAS